MSATLTPPSAPSPAAGATQGMAAAPTVNADARALQMLGQQAAQACGKLIQAIRLVPGVDTAALEQAAAGLRQGLQAAVASMRKPPQQ